MMKSTAAMILACSVIGASAVVGGAWTLSRFMLKIQNTTEHNVTVKGVSEKLVRSDVGTLSCRITVKASDMAGGIKEIDRVGKLFQTKIAELGFSPGEEELVELSHTRINKTVRVREGNRETSKDEFSHYEFYRDCRLRSTDVEKIATAALKLYELVSDGVDVSPGTPQYFISDPEQYKLELIDAATRAGYLRASSVAASCGSELGKLLTARQGVIQITRPADNQSSDDGAYDTSSIDKIIRMVVTLNFALKE